MRVEFFDLSLRLLQKSFCGHGEILILFQLQLEYENYIEMLNSEELNYKVIHHEDGQ